MKPPAEEEEGAAEERSEERDTSTARRRCCPTSSTMLPVLLPRWAKLYPGDAAMEYDDDDNDGPGMVLLRLGGSSPGL